MPQPLFWLTLVALAIAIWLAWGAVRRARFRQQLVAARHLFAQQRDACQRAFLAAATASGKPRGLTWKSCHLHDDLLLARDRVSGGLVGLVGATISFAAVEGGGMEEVEAVGNLRVATAVFTWRGGEWTSQGRTIFNLEPHEVLSRYGDSLEQIADEPAVFSGESPGAG